MNYLGLKHNSAVCNGCYDTRHLDSRHRNALAKRGCGEINFLPFLFLSELYLRLFFKVNPRLFSNTEPDKILVKGIEAEFPDREHHTGVIGMHNDLGHGGVRIINVVPSADGVASDLNGTAARFADRFGGHRPCVQGRSHGEHLEGRSGFIGFGHNRVFIEIRIEITEMGGIIARQGCHCDHCTGPRIKDHHLTVSGSVFSQALLESFFHNSLNASVEEEHETSPVLRIDLIKTANQDRSSVCILFLANDPRPALEFYLIEAFETKESFGIAL